MVHSQTNIWLQQRHKSSSLCLSEKLVICNFRDKDRLVNKRMDLVSKCQHKNKFI